VSTPVARVDFDSTLKLYRGEPLGVRLFVWARRVLAPLDAIAAHVPAEGPVLDIGCGHGVFALALARTYPNRRILGVDPSHTKIAIAERARRASGSGVEFRVCTVEAVAHEQFAVITILDMLYLLPMDRKIAVLRACRRLLAPDGVLVLKTNDTHPAWKYGVTRAQERLMTGLGLTMGTGALHFLSCHQNADLLAQTGFRAEVHHLRHWSPYPHTLFVAR
jgi:2-polyprenyl-6-hydroxyphenyl methylase/3-demethylubiquinone-9 3-methyltransferase